MSKNTEKIEGLKLAIEVLQKKVEKLEQEDLVQTFGSCPPGQIRNAQGNCVVKLD